MDKEKTLKIFGGIVGGLTVSTLFYNYPAVMFAALALVGLGAFIHKKLDK